MKKFWYFVFGLIIVAIALGLFDQKIITPISFSNFQNKISNSVRDKISSGTLIYAVKSRNFQILALSPDNTKKILFTDIDEKFKVKNLANQSESGKIAALTNQNELINIKFNDLGKVENLSKSVQVSNDYILSPDKQKYIFVRFSNAERDYGYTLFSVDLKTSIQSELIRYDQVIEDIKWLDDDKIIFIKDNNDIVVFDLSSKQDKTIFQADEQSVIYDFGVNSDMILLSQSLVSKSGCAIYSLNQNGKNIQKIYTEKSGTIYDPILSPDGQSIAYILSANVSKDHSGYIYSMTKEGKNKQKLVQANKLISWTL